jgi:putative salt-induced outer membrane protein YdiY
MARLILLALLLASGTLLRAQVVNIENKRFANDTSRWSGQGSFKFSVTENTQRSMSLGANGGVQYIRDRHRAFFVTDFTVDRVEANAFRNTGFQHLRYNRVLRGVLIAETFAQLQYNKPLRIDERWLLGLGPRAVLRNSDDLRIVLGTALMLEYEVDRVNELYYFDMRNSSYVSAAFKIEPHLQYTLILYYQPKIGEISDTRVSIESQLRLRATRRFAFDIRMNLQHDSRPAPGIPTLNYRWENAFTFVF